MLIFRKISTEISVKRKAVLTILSSIEPGLIGCDSAKAGCKPVYNCKNYAMITVNNIMSKVNYNIHYF